MKMNVLKIQNDYSWLVSDDEKLKNKLHSALRFREKGYFHSTLYKQGRWDGYREFFDRNSGRFLTGLLPEILMALKIRKSKFELSDHRGTVDFVNKSVESDMFEDVTMRDYQVDLINQVIKYKRGVIFAPTSAGKTIIMLGILKSIAPDTPILFLANRKSLVDQNYIAMKEAGLDNVGRLYDKFNEPNVITCATVQSTHKLTKLLPKFKVLIVDEIHEMMSKKPKQTYRKLKSASVRVAVSATPFKFGGKDDCQKYSVKGFFGPVLKTKAADIEDDGVLTTKKLQTRGVLSPSHCIFYPIDEPQIPYAVYQDAVTYGIAENYHFHEVVKDLVQTLKGRTLILVERIAHGDALNEMIPESLWVQGKDDLETRRYVIEQLQKSENVVGIATQQIFNAGINVFIHNLVNCASGKAAHIVIQRMGRGLRTADDKEILHYYDFIFNINDYLNTHSKKRIKILEKEGHKIEIKDRFDFR